MNLDHPQEILLFDKFFKSHLQRPKLLERPNFFGLKEQSELGLKYEGRYTPLQE
jgi:hypothetical protein